MAPKKQLTSSTPAVLKPSATFGMSSDVSAPSTITESTFEGSYEVVAKPPVLTKLSTLDLVMEAIETIGVPRKGASYLAIQKWIASSKENVMINRLKANLKKAIVKALESGLLKRPAISKNVTGLRGYFILNKDAIAQKKKDEVKTAKKLVEKAKATKVAKTKTVAVPDTKAAAVTKTKYAAVPKTKAAAVPKTKAAAVPKTKAAAIPKTKAAAIPKTKAAAIPKSKATAIPKTKAAAAPKTNDVEKIEETSKPKQKSKVAKAKQDDSEAGPSNKPKVKAAVKPRPGKSPVTKSKPKLSAGKHKPEKDAPKEKPQQEISQENGVKFQSDEDLPHLVGKKAASKPTKNMKEGRPRKLYNADSSIDISRKDLSDTELNVKPDYRKSLKSYASDTELEVTYNRKKAKVKKVLKKLDVKKHAKKETSKTDPSLTNVKKRKGKNSTADDVFE